MRPPNWVVFLLASLLDRTRAANSNKKMSAIQKVKRALILGLIPHSFQPSFCSRNSRFPLTSGGFVERRIPGMGMTFAFRSSALNFLLLRPSEQSQQQSWTLASRQRGGPRWGRLWDTSDCVGCSVSPQSFRGEVVKV